MEPSNIIPFQNYIRRWFELYGRHNLPWRQNFDPYQIMVSEIMLQQTQVDRVIPKFEQFLKTFPTVLQLADASTADVLKHWQGLGYNRRALNLQKAAQSVVQNFAGKMPQTKEELLNLPGVGPYTASAISAFAYNLPETIIETNIRAVFIHHFFPNQEAVTDHQLTPLITKTIDLDNPRLWYSALMDYGTYLKSVLPNPSRHSKHHAKQSTFAGSNRQLRGAVLRQLALKDQLSTRELLATIPERTLFNQTQMKRAINTLIQEGFIELDNQSLQLKK